MQWLRKFKQKIIWQKILGEIWKGFFVTVESERLPPLLYKTIHCHKAVLDAQFIKFFIWRKNVLFSRYRGFCVFVKSADFRTCDIEVLLHNASYTYAYFFWILSPIKMTFGQILVYCMTNIWKLVPGSFMILFKRQSARFGHF